VSHPSGVLVRHAMTHEVLVISPTETLAGAAACLRQHAISGLPVVASEGKVVGVLSEKDIARELSEANGRPASSNLRSLHGRPARRAVAVWELSQECLLSVKVQEAMSPDPVTVDPNVPLDAAAHILAERHIRRLPVVEEGKLVGILTGHDVLAALP
jgi:CBS domain-containing protein